MGTGGKITFRVKKMIVAVENKENPSPLLLRNRQVARPQKCRTFVFYKKNTFAFIFKKFKIGYAIDCLTYSFIFIILECTSLLCGTDAQ